MAKSRGNVVFPEDVITGISLEVQLQGWCCNAHSTFLYNIFHFYFQIQT